jgi:hypothetical protein
VCPCSFLQPHRFCAYSSADEGIESQRHGAATFGKRPDVLDLKPGHDKVLRAEAIPTAIACLGAHLLINRSRDGAANHHSLKIWYQMQRPPWVGGWVGGWVGCAWCGVRRERRLSVLTVGAKGGWVGREGVTPA